MWECPAFFELDGTPVHMISPQGMTQMGYDNETAFIMGSFDTESCEFTRNKIQTVDYGIDFYSSQTLLTEDGRRIMIGSQHYSCSTKTSTVCITRKHSGNKS